MGNVLRETQQVSVAVFDLFNQRNIAIFGFANNHYAGHAPATVRLFWDLWKKK